MIDADALAAIGRIANRSRSRSCVIGVPVSQHGPLRERLADLREFEPSPEEPSVWNPRSPDLLELNFVGIDPAQDPRGRRACCSRSW